MNWNLSMQVVFYVQYARRMVFENISCLTSFSYDDLHSCPTGRVCIPSKVTIGNICITRVLRSDLSLLITCHGYIQFDITWYIYIVNRSYRYRYKFYLKSEYKNIQHKLWRAFKTDIHVNNRTSIRTDMHKKQSTYIL